jgi:hypothetical protein
VTVKVNFTETLSRLLSTSAAHVHGGGVVFQ